MTVHRARMTRKRRAQKQKEGTSAFRNSPFAVLNGAVRTPASALPRAAHPSPSPGEADDAEGLFLRSVRGTRRIAADSEESRAQRPGRTAEVPGAEQEGDDDRQLFLRTLGAIGTTGFRDGPKEPEEDAPAQSSSSRMRQLKRGTIRISDELDLHGFLKDEAIRRLELFIATAYARRQQVVLVITGKGTNSPDGPVLPGAVDSWLRHQGKAMVAEFRAAPRDKGGSGAYVVFLKVRRG